jgi:hypothetical protein
MRVEVGAQRSEAISVESSGMSGAEQRKRERRERRREDGMEGKSRRGDGGDGGKHERLKFQMLRRTDSHHRLYTIASSVMLRPVTSPSRGGGKQ